MASFKVPEIVKVVELPSHTGFAEAVIVGTVGSVQGASIPFNIILSKANSS